jgi:plasmid maintenance system antidote protein VapI
MILWCITISKNSSTTSLRILEASGKIIKNALTVPIDAELAKLAAILEMDLPAFNKLVREREVPAVIVEVKSAKAEGTN